MSTNIDPDLPKALRRLYQQIPDVACKGLCWRACASVPCQEVELAHLRRVAGHDGSQEPVEPGACPFLGPDHRCQGYAARPVVCRIFGAAERLPCPFGCKPAGGYMAPRLEVELILGVEALSPGITSTDPAIRGQLLFGKESA